MSKYLNRLRALDAEKPLLQHVSKVAKERFDTFDTAQGKPFSENSCLVVPAAEAQAASAYDPIALQTKADRRNLTAIREGRTDRYCACGRLARLAWPEGNRREVWRCDECAPTAGRA
jgi:hypothetical protein